MWTEALHSRFGRRHPERGLPDGELSDDLIAFTHAVEDRGTERRLVERDGRAGAVDPQLGLKAGPHLTSMCPAVEIGSNASDRRLSGAFTTIREAPACARAAFGELHN